MNFNRREEVPLENITEDTRRMEKENWRLTKKAIKHNTNLKILETATLYRRLGLYKLVFSVAIKI